MAYGMPRTVEHFWTPPHPGESILGMTAFRDVIIIATDRGVYAMGDQVVTSMENVVIHCLSIR